jgi:PHD/YefM family antitoxin component YafN of YafNO toxin-antitoxin module
LLIDHSKGTSDSYSATQFERGDAISFELQRSIAAGQPVAKGDTVACIRSNEIEREIIHLKGELAASKASLHAIRTGEKDAVVREAESRLRLAKQQVEEQSRIVARLEKLGNQGLVSAEEFEIQRGQLRLYEINVSIAREQVNAVTSGAKLEQVDLMEAQVSALEDEISILEGRTEAFTLIAPISGEAGYHFSGDTLLSVVDTTSYILLMPVGVEKYPYLSEKQKVTVKGKSGVSGTLNRLDKHVKIVGGRQVTIATARLEGIDMSLLPGLIVPCRIDCGPVSPLEFLRRTLRGYLG